MDKHRVEFDKLKNSIYLNNISIDHSSPVQMALLLHEGLALVGMVHKHVYTVIGVAAEERVPPFLIYPDDGFRNLKRQETKY
ncbi:Tyrosine-protein kinase Drl [Orchesella cincta]|uniref:Tyrosine-protein kinase Drl n=1 Tax=Orchesella cincta TaxID=48709 RepID=A0A1D2NCD1_ORCCI|nr:Tyrosine-protein kinase Drl [Orchesella cincta]